MAKQTTAAGVIYEDIRIGDGTEVTGAGQTLIVHYTGWLEDGREFDSSIPRGTPFSFPLDVGFVIPGWDDGVKGMREKGIRKLIIPAHLAYGETGAGNMIPPNATLTFEIELVEVSE